MIPLFIKHWQV